MSSFFGWPSKLHLLRGPGKKLSACMLPLHCLPPLELTGEAACNQLLGLELLTHPPIAFKNPSISVWAVQMSNHKEDVEITLR